MEDELEVQNQGNMQPENSDNANVGSDQAMTEDDIYNMSDEDFNKNLDALGDFRIDDKEESTDKVEKEVLEQPENTSDKTTDDNQILDENEDMDSDKEENEKEDEKDSTDKKDEQTFTFDNIPMDVTLPFKMKAAGGEVQATMNELIEGFKRGLGFTQKMQEISSYRPHIAMIKENQISTDDLNRFIDIKNGDKSAMASLIKELKLDAFDIDDVDAEKYVPKQYAKTNEALDIDDVRTLISNDKENVGKVQTYLNNLDDGFYKEIVSSGRNLNGFYEDVVSGAFDTIKPVMDKIAFLDSTGKSGLQLYREAIEHINSQNTNSNNVINEKSKKVEETNKIAEEKKKSILEKQKQSEKKKVLSKPNSKSVGDNSINTQEDIWSMDSDQFDANFKKLFGESIA
jgi:hypothetical protein